MPRDNKKTSASNAHPSVRRLDVPARTVRAPKNQNSGASRPMNAKPGNAHPGQNVKAAYDKNNRPLQGVQRSVKPPLSGKKPPQKSFKPSGEELSRKLRTQTPSQREAMRRTKRVNGSIKNLEIKRREKTDKQRFYVKKKKKGIVKLLLSRLLLFLVMFILLFAMIAACFTLNLNYGKIYKGSPYQLQIGEDEKSKDTVVVSISAENAERDGVLFIPISALSELCEFTVTGLPTELRYIPRESDNEGVRFVVDSNTAYVNGARIRMIASCFVDNGKLYVPLDFFEKYTNGLIINKDDNKHKIVISRYITGKNEEDNSDIYANITFKLRNVYAIPNIPEPTE